MSLSFVTIGVYGFDEPGFFKALVNNKVDTFCDIRMRRGMRGSRYAFVNSTYLQQKLLELGIRYVHRKDLAPSTAVRSQQKEIDAAQDVTKRARTALSEAFIRAYEDECLQSFDAVFFVKSFDSAAHRVALFCVEQHPDACHRSLVANKLEQDLNIHVEHIMP
jgi:hypothetical protein